MFLAASADVLILARIELACRRGLYSSDGSGSRCMKNIRLNAVEVWIGWWPLKRAVSVDDSVAAAAYLRGESRGAEKRRIFIRCTPWLQSGKCKGDKRYLTGTTEAADPEVTSPVITTAPSLLHPHQWPRLSPVPTPPTSPAWACLQHSQQSAPGQSRRHSARRRSQALRSRSLSSPQRRRRGRGRAARHPHASPSRSRSWVQCARPRAASPSRTNTQRRAATRPCRLRPVCVY